MPTGRALAKVTIHIPNVSWRDGRPRYEPGPKARARLGVKAQDLKRPDGSWMSAEEAARWVERELRPRVAEIKAAKAAGRRPPRRRAPNAYTLEDLFEDLWRSPKFTGGAAGRKVAAPRTFADYRQKAASLAAFDAELYGSDIAALTKPILIGLHERLWSEKGHHMANAVLAVMRLALSYATRKGKLAVNPALGLALETPPERLRVGTIAEMTTLLAAADAIGETMVGHMVMLGLMTGQRQADRLALQDVGHDHGWRRFRQAKTGALVEVPETPQLAARLAAAKAERARLGVKVANVVIDPRTRLAMNEHAYRKRFARLRAAAVVGVRDVAHPDAWIVQPCPSLAEFRDQDLRDTAVTWLARAGCSIPEIRAITGHDAETIHRILKHYLAIDREQASNAIGKLVVYLEAQGAAL